MRVWGPPAPTDKSSERIHLFGGPAPSRWSGLFRFWWGPAGWGRGWVWRLRRPPWSLASWHRQEGRAGWSPPGSLLPNPGGEGRVEAQTECPPAPGEGVRSISPPRLAAAFWPAGLAGGFGGATASAFAEEMGAGHLGLWPPLRPDAGLGGEPGSALAGSPLVSGAAAVSILRTQAGARARREGCVCGEFRGAGRERADGAPSGGGRGGADPPWTGPRRAVAGLTARAALLRAQPPARPPSWALPSSAPVAPPARPHFQATVSRRPRAPVRRRDPLVPGAGRLGPDPRLEGGLGVAHRVSAVPPRAPVPASVRPPGREHAWRRAGLTLWAPARPARSQAGGDGLAGSTPRPPGGAAAVAADPGPEAAQGVCGLGRGKWVSARPPRCPDWGYDRGCRALGSWARRWALGRPGAAVYK